MIDLISPNHVFDGLFSKANGNDLRDILYDFDVRKIAKDHYDLESSSYSYDEWFEEESRREIEEYMEEDDPNFENELEKMIREKTVDEIENQIENFIYEVLSHYEKNGNLVIYRCITSKLEEEELHQNVILNNVGVFWSFYENAADCHWGSFGEGMQKILLKGIVDIHSVDWKETLNLNGNLSLSEEKEIRVHENEPILIVGIKIGSNWHDMDIQARAKINNNFIKSSCFLFSKSKLLESPRTIDDALDLFGLSFDELSVKDIQNAYRRLAFEFHPDRSEDEDAEENFKRIQHALDIIKNYIDEGQFYSSKSKETKQQPSSVPPWAWAGWYGGYPPGYEIYRENYKDLHYIQKTMWEKSGGSNQRWHVMHFDGSFFRGIFSVFGNESIFTDMAEAMNTWERYHKLYAIFANKEGTDEHHLIYLDGKYLNGNTIFYMNNDDRNSHSFRINLKSQLENLK